MKTCTPVKLALAAASVAVFGALLSPAQIDPKLPPDSTAALGQTFKEPKPRGITRVLVVGSGSSHHFPKYFIARDSEILSKEKGIETAATLNLDEALQLMPLADVIVFSGNHEQYATAAFQKALNDFADQGKGVVLLHAATWVHPWDGYNQRFVQGGSRGHGKGDIEVTVKDRRHPVMKGVSPTFSIYDESYHNRFADDAAVEVLAENGPDDQTKIPHASVWVVKDSKTRIVCVTLGHDDKAHENPAYQQILVNAVNWTGKR